MIEKHFAERTAEELLDKLIPAGMPCSAAYKVSDVMAEPARQGARQRAGDRLSRHRPGEVGRPIR